MLKNVGIVYTNDAMQFTQLSFIIQSALPSSSVSVGLTTKFVHFSAFRRWTIVRICIAGHLLHEISGYTIEETTNCQLG